MRDFSLVDVSEVEIHRDGGTMEFRISRCSAEGFYRLQTPALGVPEPLFKDGVKLDFGSLEETAALDALQAWFSAESRMSGTAQALMELDETRIWLNLPEYLSNAIPLYYIRSVIQRLQKRAPETRSHS